MSTIPNLGKYGYVGPILSTTVTAATSGVDAVVKNVRPSGNFWKKIILLLSLGLLFFCVVKVVIIYRSRNRKET